MPGTYIDSSLLFLGAFFIFVIVSVGVILVLWIAMPFSVFGVKGLLKKSIEEQQRTNRLLETLVHALHRSGTQDEEQAPEKREDLH